MRSSTWRTSIDTHSRFNRRCFHTVAGEDEGEDEGDSLQSMFGFSFDLLWGKMVWNQRLISD